MILGYVAAFVSLLTVVRAAPEVHLGNTVLVGRDVTASKQEFFGGIPFAEPPLGNRRFMPPIQKHSMDVPTFDASGFGPGCLQPHLPLESQSEDCLTINVFRPAGLSSEAGLPVMAYIYGGGFFLGTSSAYNATAIIDQSVARGTPVIYVNFNYRLGPLGFPRGREASNQNALNLGLKDQWMALEWIQNHIVSFGGDRNKVTVFGESAGAVSASILMLDRRFENLARAVIMQSGSASALPAYHPERYQVDWVNFVSAVPECAPLSTTDDTFDCLRTANSTTIVQATNFVNEKTTHLIPWFPVLDGSGGFLPDQPSRLLIGGDYARLPFITGTCLDEGPRFVRQTTTTTEEIQQWLTANNSPWRNGHAALTKVVERILELYPDVPADGSPFNTGNETFGLSSQFKRASAILTDMVFESSRRHMNQFASRDGLKTFGYLFTDPNVVVENGFSSSQKPAPGSLGVAHAGELAFLYGYLLGVVSPTVDTFIPQMIDYWVSFATSLTPNDGLGTQRPEWEQYTPTNQVLIRLDSGNLTNIPDTHRTRQIAFLNRAFGRRSPGWLNRISHFLQENVPVLPLDRFEL